MDENFAYWFASFQRAGKWFSSSLALGIDVVADIADMLSSEMPCLHDRANRHHLPNFNPHGGPITHSSTGSKPDSAVHPLFLSLFLAHGLVCNSRATFREIINSGIKQNTYSRCFEPLSRPVTGIERLPTRLKLLMVPSYFALDVFHLFNSRDTHLFIHGIPHPL